MSGPLTLYYFHLRDGVDLLLDPDGRELNGVPDIARAALTAARSIISHDALGGRIRLNQHIDVQDGAGAVVHSLCFVDAVEIVGG